MKRISFLICLLLAAGYALNAQPLELSVEDAVNIALKNNSDIKQAEKDLAIAQADLGAAYADLFMPTLQLSGSFGYTDPVSSSSPYNDAYSFGLSLRRDLFTGGKWWFAKEGKRHTAELAALKLDNRKKEITRGTRIGFYNLLLLKEKLRVAQENDRSLRERLEVTRVNYLNGIASELDYLKDQVKYKNNQPLLLKARNDYRIAQINFINSIGLSSADALEPAGKIEDSMSIIPLSTDESAIAEQAINKDIGLANYDYQILIKEADKAALVAARYPQITGVLNYKYDYKTDSGGDRVFVPGLAFTLSCTIPLDPWIPALSKLSNQAVSADESIAKTKLQREQSELALKTRVKTLLLNIHLAEQNIESQRENVSQARLALDIAARQYREGSISSLDLSDAEVTYNQAVANYLQALYDRYTGVLDLNDLIE